MHQHLLPAVCLQSVFAVCDHLSDEISVYVRPERVNKWPHNDDDDDDDDSHN